jgi:cytochrome c-type biogenesis protein CcmF
MENLGALSLILAFFLAVYAVIGSAVGQWKDKPFLVLSAQRSVYAVWALTTLASAVLVHAFLISDFRLAYVVSHSNLSMPQIYKFTAWWGGMEGSLLLWAWILATYSFLAVFLNRKGHRALMPWVTATLMTTQAFFLGLVAFLLSPFDVIAVGKSIQTMQDGQGLNAALQYWAMVIHPPTLYLGYVGFIVPFAFATASLISKAPGDAWIHITRKWCLIAYLFQSAGILLGALWAYAALGWGGYWAWDPVENASLMPWITATAFLHSVMMQEKKGMMKIWNVTLISATFFLCIFGTFLTRSGIISSVHAFAEGNIGRWFAWFLVLHIAASTVLIVNRLDYLKSESQLESVVSRESSFLFNNLILIASCFSILWGTMFPVISEAVTGEKISVGSPFFNKVNIPIGLFLMFLTGVGPLIAWRRSSTESLQRAFLKPLIGGAVVTAGLFALGMRHAYALIALYLCAFVLFTIGIEFWKGARAIAGKTRQNIVAAMVELTHRNTRRYGGYLVHIAMVMLFVGFTGKAFDQEKTVEVQAGDTWKLGRYELRVNAINGEDTERYTAQYANIDVYSGGKKIDEVRPERRAYKTRDGDQNSIVAIRRRLNEDLYISFAGMREGKAIIQSYVFPLIAWLVIGFLTFVFGMIVCLIPNKVRVTVPARSTVGSMNVPGTGIRGATARSSIQGNRL